MREQRLDALLSRQLTLNANIDGTPKNLTQKTSESTAVAGTGTKSVSVYANQNPPDNMKNDNFEAGKLKQVPVRTPLATTVANKDAKSSPVTNSNAARLLNANSTSTSSSAESKSNPASSRTKSSLVNTTSSSSAEPKSSSKSSPASGRRKSLEGSPTKDSSSSSSGSSNSDSN